MQKESFVKISQVKCFGQSYGFGNDVIVVEDSTALKVQDRLAYTKYKNTTCVFVSNINDAQIELDYYYPHKHSPLCLHATMGASYIWFKNNPLAENLTVITHIKNQKIFVEKIKEKIFLTITKENFLQSEVSISSSLIKQFLEVDDLKAMEYYIASCGSPKLFIEISNNEQLYLLTPNLELINKWSDANRINGLYVYCKISDNTYSGRNFNHLDSRLEDAATGIAAATITYHLKRNLIIYQGENLGNKCVITTEFVSNIVKITGNIEMVSDVELDDKIMLESCAFK